jgi:hypothetical protein
MHDQQSSRPLITPATVAVRPFLLKPRWMNGLSERLLVSHCENNYAAGTVAIPGFWAYLAIFAVVMIVPFVAGTTRAPIGWCGVEESARLSKIKLQSVTYSTVQSCFAHFFF